MAPVRSLGLDLSLTSSGVVCLDQERDVVLEELIGSRGRRSDPMTARVARVRDLAQRIEQAAGEVRPDVAVIESPAYGKSADPGFYDRAMLTYAVCDAMDAIEVPWAMVPPASLKLFLSGRGDATKAVMLASARRLVPEARLDKDDAADAAGLALMGLARLGAMDVAASRASVLDGCQWPMTH